MFIEQLKEKKINHVLYLLVIIGFFGMMIINTIASDGVNVNQMMADLIKQVGVNIAFVLMIIPLSIMCLGLLFWVKIVHRQSITSFTTSRKSIDWNRIFFSFGLWSLFTIAMTIVGYYLEPENFVFNFNLIPFLIFLVLALVLIPLQTSFEEYFFRGYLMQYLGIVSNGKLVPFLTTSILFGLMHIANPEVEKMGYVIMVYYIGTGFLLGIMTLMDDGLELSLGFHAANNLIGALLVTSDWSALQTHSVLKDISLPEAGLDIILPVITIYPIILFILSKKYGWTNWKEKLTGRLTDLSTHSVL